jgi:hypothetical protein
MTTMLEKMALAIYHQAWGTAADKRWHNDAKGRAHFTEQARAALMAIKDLDNATMDAAVNAAQAHEPNIDGAVGYVQVRAAHDAMIDAILNEKTP